MDVSHEAGWNDDLTALWFQFLDEKGGKGVSKDTWSMVGVVMLPVCHTVP
jgi:DCN1-like protein 1/2